MFVTFWLSILVASGFALIHISSKYLFTTITGLPKKRVLSFAGGIAVSYVFVHLLPELQDHQKILEKSRHLSFLQADHHAYLVTLIGLTLFYGLEVMVRHAKKKSPLGNHGVFWIHILSFFTYNALIGYLINKEYDEKSMWEMISYFIALAVHFVANDHSLRDHHQQIYDRYGRWLLASSVLFGWGLSLWMKVDDAILSSLTAFLIGGIVLNVLKEELPEEKKSNFPAFAFGLIGYSLLLLFSS